MGLFFGEKREAKPWGKFGKRPKGPQGPKRPGDKPGWRDNLKNVKGVQAAQAKKEQLLAEAEKDSVLIHLPEELPTNLPAKRFAGVAVMCFIFVLALLVLVGLEIRHTRLGREVSSLTSRKVALIEENRHYRTEMSRITVVGDLEQVARENLGLVPPAEGQIVIIP
ncbi:MAG: cell division protein FtsL [Deltaproteobacteria bacterium]|jgi:hypothetical protein|nr:cell division protein FtsL [Deltaproteobacteria bacterium]